jgi:hypothetical protein
MNEFYSQRLLYTRYYPLLILVKTTILQCNAAYVLMFVFRETMGGILVVGFAGSAVDGKVTTRAGTG